MGRICGHRGITFYSLLIGRYGCRVTSIIAGCVASIGFLASFFAPNLHFLYLSFGLVGGTGLGLAMVPAVVAVSSYFRKRRGLALSTSSVGAGVGTMCFPPLFRVLIEEYGWRGLMLVLSGVALNLVVCGALFMMPAKSNKKLESNDHVQKTGICSRCTRQYNDFFAVLHNRAFTVILVIITTTYLVYIVPFVHLPDLARLTGVTKGNASFLVSIMGIAGIAGRLVFGFVSTLECVSVLLCHAGMLLVCGVATLLCTLIHTYTLFAVYAAVHGGFIGSYTGFIAVVITEIVGLDQTANALGMLTFLGGICILLASPLAGFLYDTTGSYLTSFYFTGVVFLVCGFVYVGLILYRRHQRLHVSIN
ncbi:monocarboxylate transporter 14-like isoform X1 [Haliotis rubra]|uniref:monocarboxylate transporter 14-like isoform X1 n=2 Tax=Haliotis rubra TaxID=36100 RepID=UPI001EE601B5|nr:monocarboxylate transporter 14-like isoform X1 [Haliotis rubra]